MIGRLLDNRYELVEFVGKGGMALVYRAIDHRTGHSVAVKILRPEFNQDAEFSARFEREATTASKMSHHNIVNLLDVGQAENMRYLVMEYVQGRTLKEVIRQTIFSIAANEIAEDLITYREASEPEAEPETEIEA